MAGRMLLGVCAVMMAIAVANAAEDKQVASVVVGLARCADCTRKNMKAETAFKGTSVTWGHGCTWLAQYIGVVKLLVIAGVNFLHRLNKTNT